MYHDTTAWELHQSFDLTRDTRTTLQILLLLELLRQPPPKNSRTVPVSLVGSPPSSARAEAQGEALGVAPGSKVCSRIQVILPLSPHRLNKWCHLKSVQKAVYHPLLVKKWKALLGEPGKTQKPSSSLEAFRYNFEAYYSTKEQQVPFVRKETL